MRVAIVDDAAVVRARLVAMLSAIPGVEVIGGGEDAIDHGIFIRNTEPDVVIIDVTMSGFSGMNLLKEIKKRKPNPVVIMLANNAHPLYRMKCVETGVEYFLDKSTEFEKIPKILKQLA